MNILLSIGLLLITGYTLGWLLDKFGLPRVIGYVATAILFSPNTITVIPPEIIQATDPVMEVCLGFIAFEVGGALKWLKLKKHEKEIISITIFESIIPYVLFAIIIFTLGIIFPDFLQLSVLNLILLTLLLAALASPTALATTLAVLHQYNSKGKVTDTILGVVALDDVLRVVFFTLTIAVTFMFGGQKVGYIVHPFSNSIYKLITAAVIVTAVVFLINPLSKLLKIRGDG
jgi:Kef-type K+ transport system membrane component KefB